MRGQKDTVSGEMGGGELYWIVTSSNGRRRYHTTAQPWAWVGKSCGLSNVTAQKHSHIYWLSCCHLAQRMRQRGWLHGMI